MVTFLLIILVSFLAPEMIATKSYSQQCDVWSMGVIMYILIVGKFPFYSTNEQQLYLLVKTHEIDFDSSYKLRA